MPSISVSSIRILLLQSFTWAFTVKAISLRKSISTTQKLAFPCEQYRLPLNSSDHCFSDSTEEHVSCENEIHLGHILALKYSYNFKWFLDDCKPYKIFMRKLKLNCLRKDFIVIHLVIPKTVNSM